MERAGSEIPKYVNEITLGCTNIMFQSVFDNSVVQNLRNVGWGLLWEGGDLLPKLNQMNSLSEATDSIPTNQVWDVK